MKSLLALVVLGWSVGLSTVHARPETTNVTPVLFIKLVDVGDPEEVVCVSYEVRDVSVGRIELKAEVLQCPGRTNLVSLPWTIDEIRHKIQTALEFRSGTTLTNQPAGALPSAAHPRRNFRLRLETRLVGRGIEIVHAVSADSEVLMSAIEEAADVRRIFVQLSNGGPKMERTAWPPP